MVNRITDINKVTEVILARRAVVPEHRSLLVGLSGIDGSGKGFLANQIVARLWQHAISTASINVDSWLNLPQKRFNPDNPAEHFYEHAIRFDEMFQNLVLPLRNSRSSRVVANIAEETATDYREQTYTFDNVDVIVLEGIFLFKREFQRHFDLSIWIECSLETALVRALRRNQEGLPPASTIRAYQTIYFPAQRIHLDHDHPRGAADLIIDNDPYLVRQLRAEHDDKPGRSFWGSCLDHAGPFRGAVAL